MTTATLALAGLLAGCGDGGDADDALVSVPSTSPVETTDPEVTETTTAVTEPPATDAPVETAPPTTEAPSTTAPTSGDCLVGDWIVTEAEMDAYYAGLMSTLDAPLTMDTDGSAPLSFTAEGTYAWAPDFALVVEVAGQRGTGNVGGTITGSYTAVEGVVTTASDVNALTVSIDVNGITFDGADLANGMLNSSPVNGVTYSCEGPTPVIDFKTADPTVTVPVTLTPA